jgi:uncharacterized membrane protein (UPF0127 family)
MQHRLSALALLLAFAIGAQAQDAPQPRLASITLNAGIHNIRAEVARTVDEQTVGLMHRREMGPNEGMLFVYDLPGMRCFWMKNTLLPLSIAFLADDGAIVNIEDMAPLSLDRHCSQKPVRYALEMHQGWFAKRGIKPGAQLTGGPFTR